MKLCGIGDDEIVTMSRFDIAAEIDDLSFDVTFYVVRETDAVHSFMIGNSLMEKAVVVISNGEAKFKGLSSKNMLLRECESIC